MSEIVAKSGGEVLPRNVSLWVALRAQDRATWPVVACLIVCWLIFLWAAAKGFDFRDESLYLVMVSRSYTGAVVTNFGDVLHPLYRLLGGDIGWFRVSGALILGGGALLFGLTFSRFLGAGRDLAAARLSVLTGLGACIFWQYDTWYPTPNYNTLNLCGLLLLFSGLIASTFSADRSKLSSAIFREALVPATLSGLGLCIVALTKPTTCATGVILGLAWVGFLRPRRPVLYVALTAAISAILLAAAFTLIDGSIPSFIARKFLALNDLRAADTNGDLHGITGSITAPFSHDRWKLLQGIPFVAAMLAIGVGWSWLLLSATIRPSCQRAAIIAVAALLGVVVAWWRAVALLGGGIKGYHAWYLALLLMLVALSAYSAWSLKGRFHSDQRRVLAAAMILALTPLIYAFGSDTLLILHAGSAGIFWAAAMMLVAQLAPPSRKAKAVHGVALLCATATIGMLAGTMITPGHDRAPIWQQTVPVTIGPQNATLSVQPQIAAYIVALQRAAHDHGFKKGMAIVDLAGMGPGMEFVLGGKVLGAPFLRVENGSAQPRALLNRVPKADLRRAWVVTGPAAYLNTARAILLSQGIEFPRDYEKVGEAKRDDAGWIQTLWKPRR